VFSTRDTAQPVRDRAKLYSQDFSGIAFVVSRQASTAASVWGATRALERLTLQTGSASGDPSAARLSHQMSVRRNEGVVDIR
jgi:hypothetical protein